VAEQQLQLIWHGSAMNRRDMCWLGKGTLKEATEGLHLIKLRRAFQSAVVLGKNE